jgi:hypothetical protein
MLMMSMDDGDGKKWFVSTDDNDDDNGDDGSDDVDVD